MNKTRLYLIILLASLWLTLPVTITAQSGDQAIVRAVLFYSPTCPHCHTVINELLIPMLDEQGESLQIMGIDTTTPDGGSLYQAAIEHYQIPSSRRGVPTLIIGQTVLVGSGEIPEQFPSLVEEVRADGGIDWPDIPGLGQIIPPEAEQAPTITPETAATTAPTNTPQATTLPTATALPAATSTPIAAIVALGQAEPPTAEMPAPDPAGFTLAGIITIAMVVVLGYTVWQLVKVLKPLLRQGDKPAPRASSLVIPVLAMAGLGVAVYLAYVEISQVEAVCGPIGQCNVVQSSPYAQIFGIPVAVLGMLYYMAVLVLWGGQFMPNHRLAHASTLVLLGSTIFSTLFSIYLTLLELFVIHAVCIWCLSSAVISTLLMLLVVQPVSVRLGFSRI